MSVLTGQAVELSAASRRTSQTLSRVDQSLVQEGIREQLLRSPSSLADATEGLWSGRPPTTRWCRCRATRQSSATKIWGLSFRAEESSEHRPRCAYAASGTRSWSYSARTALMPFLNATLELALESTTRPGYSSISPSLRFHGVVRRSQSPLFQAFDRLPAKCIASPYSFRRVESSDHSFHYSLSTYEMNNLFPYLNLEYQPGRLNEIGRAHV